MKKVLQTLGCLGLVLIILVVGFFYHMVIEGQRLDASSKAYIDANIPTIIFSWSQDEVIKRASKKLQEDLIGVNWNMFLAKVKPLGQFQSYKGCEGQAHILMSPQTGKVITAIYTSHAYFQNGPANIKTKLIWRDNGWQISTIQIDSPLFQK